MNVQDRIKKAHIAIMQHKKFCAYSGVVACGKVEISEDVPTAATDGWNVIYNPKFVADKAATDAELRFLILHEATHKAYRHMMVWRALANENARMANVAMDHFVNLSLQDTDDGEGFIRMLSVGIQPAPKYRGWSVKQIFDDLKQQQDDDSGEGMDEHDWSGDGEGMGKPSDQAIAQEIERAVRQGEILRKKLAGKGAGDSEGVFGDLLTPKIDWRKVLREFVTETCAGRDESSWRKPNRRYLSEDIYMPTMVGTTMTELVIGFDTSGSVFNGAEMMQFVAEIERIVADVAPQKVHVIYWDTEVAGHQTFEDGQFAVQNLKVKGGGGTDGSVLFDYLRDHNIHPQAIVQFTDGYVGSWGTSDVPTLWAITESHIKAPWGTTVNF